VRDLIRVDSYDTDELCGFVTAVDDTVRASVSSVLFINTIEAPELAKIRHKISLPAFAIGPLHLLFQTPPEAGVERILHAPNHGCLAWPGRLGVPAPARWSAPRGPTRVLPSRHTRLARSLNGATWRETRGNAAVASENARVTLQHAHADSVAFSLIQRHSVVVHLDALVTPARYSCDLSHLVGGHC
jgi:hypothetical protein